MRWAGMQILVIGAGRQGLALARYLAEAGAEVTLNDRLSLDDLMSARAVVGDLPIRWVGGGHPLELLSGIDMVCPSGGVPLTIPLIIEAVNRGIPLSNDSQIFLEEAPCRVVGITGSAGKSTTTALVGRILTEAYLPSGGLPGPGDRSHPVVWVGGNIGNPLITDLPKMVQQDLAIVELSSFQLEVMTASPDIAVVLNITPNHLDRHGTMGAYIAAKKRILDHQTAGDTAVLNRDDPISWSLRSDVLGNLVSFGINQPEVPHPSIFLKDGLICASGDGEFVGLFPKSGVRLRGGHNLDNVMAAAAVARSLNLSPGAIRSGIEAFDGLPHRLEFVREWRGSSWYNDSIATAPERTIAAIRSFDAPIILLAGGRDKDLPWDEAAQEISRRVDHLIAFGESATLIINAVQAYRTGPRPITITQCDTLDEAVTEASRIAEVGDVVLLAPGGTSFDEFGDFEERGERYKEWVNSLS